MTRHRTWRLTTIAWLLLVVRFAPFEATLWADGWELSGGYSMLRESKDQITFPVGWSAGGAHSFNTWLSVVVDVDGQRKVVPSIGSDIVLTSHALLAGVRASRALGRFTESAQVCAGALRAGGDAFGSSSTSTSLAFQPGLALDYRVGGRWSARAGVDLRLIHTGEQVRVVGAIVYKR